jgi:glycosyltransferase involved in cell wall biosynthesis
VLLVGVRGHGGEEVYSALLRDAAPPGVETSATLDFHRSCPGGRCHALAEAALNRGLYPFLAFDLGFRVLGVGPEIDLVHVHSHPTVLRDRRRRPVVFSAGSSHYHCLRDYEGWSEGRIARRYARARRLYPRLGVLDALLNHEAVTLSYTFSSWAREAYLEHGVPAWKVRILPPGFPLPPPRRASPAEGVTFLFLGRAPGRKGGDLVLQAFARLRQTLPAARLLYVCEAPPPHPLPGVEALPLVPPGEVSVLYRRADVLVNPTRAEGFGFTNVEAQGHGLPVISTRIAAVPEVVENGRTGILVEPGDGAGVLEAMRRLGSESALRAEMGAAARARFETLFSLGVFRRGLGALYEEARDRAGA